jgi:hypothetical protein
MSPKAATAFHDAIDSPSNSHATSSQRTSGAARIWSSSWSGVRFPIGPEVQVSGPCHQPRSTPVW